MAYSCAVRAPLLFYDGSTFLVLREILTTLLFRVLGSTLSEPFLPFYLCS